MLCAVQVEGSYKRRGVECALCGTQRRGPRKMAHFGICCACLVGSALYNLLYADKWHVRCVVRTIAPMIAGPPPPITFLAPDSLDCVFLFDNEEKSN